MSVTLHIPDDPAECRQLLEDLPCRNDALRQQAETAGQRADDARQRADDARRRVDELERVLDRTAAQYDRLKQEHAELEETLALLRRYLFGRRRERVLDDPGQGHLFDIPEFLVEPEPAPPIPADDAAAPPKAARPPRRTRLDHLPHIRIEHDLPEDDKTGSCCGEPLRRIGEDESRELEFIPAQLRVNVHILPKYACPTCRDGLVAFVVVSKFADHLPLYRLEDILTRHGVYLARSTLCDWVRNAAELLEPLAELQKARVLPSPILWTDDTPVTVLGGEKPGSSTGRSRVYIGDDQHPYSVYDFTISRERDGPAEFLEDFRGFLQADAYGGYDGIYLDSRGRIVEVACWAHARRKFFDALSNAPREANQVLEWIRQMYAIEDRARDFTPAARQVLRQRESVPILDRIEKSLDELKERMLPKSALGKAVNYARNPWAALRRYTTDGRLTIDNNVSERTLRLQAIGRNNGKFLGSAEAGPRAAVLFTILAGAKRHRLEPWAYLRDVVLKLSAGETDLESLLPDRWAASHPEMCCNTASTNRGGRRSARRKRGKSVARSPGRRREGCRRRGREKLEDRIG